MKAPNFSYEKARSLSEAISILVEHDGDAVPLAGGQSLMATLNLRLSSPKVLVDITGLDELKGISLDNGFVRIGALTRHVELLRSGLIRQALPLLGNAVGYVAHAAIRNRGTIGGSVAYADPAAELPACVVTLDAVILIEGPSGRRQVAAENFFKGLFETDLQPGELIVEFLIPAQSKTQKWSFLEISRRRGDFAMAGISVVADVFDDVIASARVAFFGCSDYPAVARETSQASRGRRLDDVALDWVDAAVARDLVVQDTPGYRADTKLRLATVLTKRAFRQLAFPSQGLAPVGHPAT
jgi:carbon-monoxide dehydrogenase medium subunit